MVDIDAWMRRFVDALDETFGPRVWFVGLQGSYGRGEATETSDIDTVVILDRLSPADLRRYRAMLDALPHRELTCGFLAGRGELLCWDAADLFQFYHDTRPIRGSLDALLPLLDDGAVQRAIHTGACGIYHGCVHNMLYGRSEAQLRGLYKSASFVVQAVCYARTGRYFARQAELLDATAPEEQRILRTFWQLKQGGDADFDPMSEALFAWARQLVLQNGQV